MNYILTEVIHVFTGIISRYSKDEIYDIAMKIHAAISEASDGGSSMTSEEALDIIDDIIVAYLE